MVRIGMADARGLKAQIPLCGRCEERRESHSYGWLAIKHRQSGGGLGHSHLPGLNPIKNPRLITGLKPALPPKVVRSCPAHENLGPCGAESCLARKPIDDDYQPFQEC